MGNDDAGQHSSEAVSDDFARAMLCSPRGLRLAFETACLSIQKSPQTQDLGEDIAWQDLAALREAAYDESVSAILSRRGPGERGWAGLPRHFGPGYREPAEPQMPGPLPYEALAGSLGRYQPAAPSGPELLDALITTVFEASYWGEVHGEEVLASREPIRQALFPFACVAAQAILHFGLDSLPDPDEQWFVDFDNSALGVEHGLPPTPAKASALLEQWWDRTTARESRAILDVPADPAARYSGEWWSTPPNSLMITSPAWPASMTEPGQGPHPGEPTGLRIVEDPHGWERATVYRLASPRALREPRLFIIDGPRDWAWLCGRFPFEVSASRRHDWHRITGGVEPWFIPDFDAIAAEFDAVHLSLRGYLSSAGIAIPVPFPTEPDEGAQLLGPGLPTRTPRGHAVLAGWAPLTTYWLVDAEVDPDSGSEWEGDGQRAWSPSS
ncbi:hypothetical protein [Arthrobacter sp. NPDC090010]|uniref:hypothetical protein n=1 Tax=Arthrobacter sp. NPDC090010 TaxID=3363942 RepID=UPI003817D9D3